MTTKYWLAGLSGDFGDAADWIGGPPASTDSAVINAAGAYTVTVDDSQTLQYLTLSGHGAKLLEMTTGALTVSKLSVDNGASATLSAANHIGTLALGGGTVTADDPSALFETQVMLDGGSLVAAVDLTVAELLLGPAAGEPDLTDVLAAARGATLTLATFLQASPSGSAVQFGLKGDTGTIFFDSSGWNYPFGISIDYGTVKLGSSGAAVFASQLSNVAKGATLDLNGNDAGADLSVHLNSKGRPGDGTITSSFGAATLQYEGNFSGNLTGGLSVKFADHSTFGGTMSIAGDAVLAGALTLTSAGVINTDLALTGTSGGPDAVLIYGGIRSLVLSGDLSGSGELVQQGRGTLTLTHANSFSGGAELDRGTTVIGANQALGVGTIIIDGGTLLASADIDFSNTLNRVQAATIAAANDRVLTLSGGFSSANPHSTLTFGASGASGTVVDALSAYSGSEAIVVAFGALQFSGVAGSDALTANAVSTTVRAGTQLDLAGHTATVTALLGTGSVASSASTAHLTLNGGNFGGVISGLIAVEIGQGDAIYGPGGGAILTGSNIYTGGTIIDAGTALVLGAGGKTGSVTGAIADNGLLIIDHSNNITVSNAISGSGGLIQDGAGVVTLTDANTYSGGTTVSAGTLYVSNGSTLGGGQVTIEGGVLSSAGATPLGDGYVILAGGELLERAAADVGNSILIAQGGGTIAAAHGTMLTLTGYFEDDNGPAVSFGDKAGHDGTIVFAPSAGDPEYAQTFHVAAGLVQLGSTGGAAVFADNLILQIDAGATLDLNGYMLGPYGPGSLAGAGVITNTSATAATLVIYQNPHVPVVSSTFDGAVSGALTLEVQDDLTLTGAGTFTNLQIDAGAAVTLGGAASEKISFSGGGGELALTGAAHLTGVIYGFGGTDEIDLQGISLATATHTYNATSHVLTVRDGTHSVGLKLNGAHVDGDFVMHDDGTGHVLITDPSAVGGSLVHSDFVV